MLNDIRRMAAWEMTLWSLNYLNSYNLTKDSLFNAQIHLRGHILRHLRGASESKPGRKRCWAEPQTQPYSWGTQLGAQSRKGRNWVVAETPFSWGRKKIGGRQSELWLSPDTWAGTQHRGAAMVTWLSASGQRNKTTEHGHPEDS